MDDPATVGVGHRLTGVEEVPQQGEPIIQAIARGHHLAEGLAAHAAHHIVGAAILHTPELIDRHNARVLELRRDSRLAQEPHRQTRLMV